MQHCNYLFTHKYLNDQKEWAKQMYYDKLNSFLPHPITYFDGTICLNFYKLVHFDYRLIDVLVDSVDCFWDIQKLRHFGQVVSSLILFIVVHANQDCFQKLSIESVSVGEGDFEVSYLSFDNVWDSVGLDWLHLSDLFLFLG